MTDQVQELEEHIDGADSKQDVVTDAGTPQEPTPSEPVVEFDPEDVDEAKLFGWKSPDEWQGEKPQGYIDNPAEYLDRVKRSRIFSTMQTKLDEQARESQETTRRLAAMNDSALKRQKAQFEAEISRITEGQRAAVEDADTATFDKLEKQRQDVIGRYSEQSTQAQPQVDPYFQEYAASDAGAWVANPILKQAAAQLINANPAMLAKPAKAQIEYAEAEIRKMYPAYFPKTDDPKPKPQTRQVVDGGGLAGGGVKQTAFSKLPADAKAQFSRFVQEGTFENTKADQEEYANEYFNS